MQSREMAIIRFQNSNEICQLTIEIAFILITYS